MDWYTSPKCQNWCLCTQVGFKISVRRKCDVITSTSLLSILKPKGLKTDVDWHKSDIFSWVSLVLKIGFKICRLVQILYLFVKNKLLLVWVYFETTSIEKHPRICFFPFHSISVWNFENILWTFKKCSFKGSILDVTVNLQLKVPGLMIFEKLERGVVNWWTCWPILCFSSKIFIE